MLLKKVLKNQKAMMFITVLSLSAAVFSLVVFANSVNPGSSGDPLVSKSYVDEKFNELANLLDAAALSPGGVSESRIVDKVLDQIDTIISAESGSKFKPVFAEKNQVIMGGEGTEIILRSGTAAAYVPVSDGVVNATTGQELFNNTTIPANNIIIVPREDGRGVTALTDSWFIVKGGYTIIN